MLLTFSHCFNNTDVDFAEIIKRVMNNYSIKDYVYAITTDNADANSTL